MNEMFSQGGKGSTGILTNKQAIARKFGVKQNEVVYAKSGQSLSGYKVIYDKVTQRSYALPSNLPAGAIITSLTDGILVHNTGTVDLGALAVLRGEFVTLVENFTSGFTIRAKNEVVSDGVNLYRWGGSLPKTVNSGETLESTGGMNTNAWIGVVSLNNSFLSVNALRASENLNKNIPLFLSSYYEGIDGGGGSFYVDTNDTTSPDNNGTVFVNASGQRIKRILDGVCRWSDFGILPGMPVAPTKSQCEAVWSWGFANGCTRYETFQKGEMTFTFPLLFQVPANWTGGAVSFIAEGLHKFAYDFKNGATDDVIEILLKLEDLSGNTPIHTVYNFDNVGMGRFPGKTSDIPHCDTRAQKTQ